MFCEKCHTKYSKHLFLNSQLFTPYILFWLFFSSENISSVNNILRIIHIALLRYFTDKSDIIPTGYLKNLKKLTTNDN